MVERRTEWSDLRQEPSNKIEACDIPDSDSTDVALQAAKHGNRDENGAMGNGGEPVRTPEKLGDLGGSKSGTDSDGYEKEKAGMVRAL